MSIRNNIEELLFKSGISMYEVSKETGIAQTTLSRYTRQETDLDNMRLGHAIKLNDFYNKNKGAIEMEKIYEMLNDHFLINGENEEYAIFYTNKEEVLNDMDHDLFKEKFEVDIDEVEFPIITFDHSSNEGGQVFQADENDQILDEAVNYFETKKESEETYWEREGYTVEEIADGQFLVEDNEGEEIATIGTSSLEDKLNIVKALNDGEDVNGWEDGNGNTINIERRKEMKDLREWEVIEKINEILEEDVTEEFHESQERSAINGTDFFYVSNSHNATVKVNVYMSDDEVDVLYSIDEDVFREVR